MIRIGIIGAGPNGTGNARKLASHSDRCKVVAVADPSTAAATTLAAEFEAATFDSLEPMLYHVDAVVISSPNWLHPEQAIACASAGKHVWIEKPMALTSKEGDAIARAVAGAGVASMIGFSVRFDKNSTETIRRIKAGDLGTVYSITSRRNGRFKPEALAGWRGDHARSGGVMSELIIHEFDWAVTLLGFPKTVYGRKRVREGVTDPHPMHNDHVWATFAYDNDVNATIEGSQCAPIADFTKVVIGTEGSLHTRKWGSELYLKRLQDEKDQLLETTEGFDKHGHFLDVIEGRCASVADAAYGAKITRLIETTLQSAVANTVLPFYAG